MGWRIVVISSPSRLNYKNNFLIIRNEELKMIHLSEINSVILENPQISLTNYLINEFVKNKVQLICCDERHNPCCELVPYYQAHNSSLKLQKQTLWQDGRKKQLNTYIIYNKIKNQSLILKKYNKQEYLLLERYLQELEFDDNTNREGHAAKVYFNALFSKRFTREEDNVINSLLNYGYSIILSCFNRELAIQGYATQLGINHKNQFNEFNFSCDLMEVFRCVVDDFVVQNLVEDFNSEIKHSLVDLLNRKVKFKGKEYYVANAIREFVVECIKFLNCESEKYYSFDYEL